MNKLPDNWELKTLSEVGDIIGGGTPNTTKEEYWNGDILWVIPSEVTSLPTKYLYTTERKITELGLKNSSAKIIKPNSLIICTRATIGDCCINRNEVSTNQGFKSIIPNENYDVVFLYYLISNSKQKLISKASGTTFLEISKSNLANLTFNFPPLEEQKRIASALSKVDAYLENTIKLTESKERFKRAIAKKLLTCKENKNVPEARFDGFEDEWETVKLDDMFDNLKEKNKENKIILASTRDRGVIPNSFTKRKIIRKKGSLSNFKFVEKGCFVISLMSFQGGFEYSDYEGIISPAYTILKPKIEIAHYFYKYFFKSYKFIKDLSPYVEGIRHGKQIKFSACKNILVPYPNIKEQEKIAEFLSLLDAEIDNLKKQAEGIKRLKKGLMKKLMSGEIRV